MKRTFLWISLVLASLVACGDDDDTAQLSDRSDADSGTDSNHIDSGIDSGSDTDTDEPNIERGQIVYRNRCSRCHGMTGSGGTGPNLDVRVPGLTEEELRVIIRDGTGSMQGLGASINDFDLESLVLYLIETHG